MSSEASLSDEKAQKSMIDAARLAEELRQEQDVAQMFERDRKLLEVQLKDAQQRLDEAETNALKGGKKAINKMEETRELIFERNMIVSELFRLTSEAKHNVVKTVVADLPKHSIVFAYHLFIVVEHIVIFIIIVD